MDLQSAERWDVKLVEETVGRWGGLKVALLVWSKVWCSVAKWVVNSAALKVGT